MIELVLAQHEVEAAISIMKRAWWPVSQSLLLSGFQHDRGWVRGLEPPNPRKTL